MRTHDEYLQDLDEALTEPDPKERYAAALAVYKSRTEDLKVIWAAIEQTQRLRQFPNGSDGYAEALELYRIAKEAHKASWTLVTGKPAANGTGTLDDDDAANALASLKPAPKPRRKRSA